MLVACGVLPFLLIKEMLYYALGALAVALLIILGRGDRRGGDEEDDLEWDARCADRLSATLRDRFTRF